MMSFSPESLPADVKDALQRGNTIEAIKLLRASSGLGLKEAKDVIDAHHQGRPIPLQSQAFPERLPAAVALALQQGNKIEAVRLLREQTGMGLKEAKDAVEASQQGSGAIDSDALNVGASPGQVTRRSGLIWGLLVAGIACVVAYSLLRSPG